MTETKSQPGVQEALKELIVKWRGFAKDARREKSYDEAQATDACADELEHALSSPQERAS